MRTRLRSTRGQHLVEFALVAVMFVTIVLAIIDFGIYLFKIVSVSHATREGVRVAAMNNLTRAQIRDKVIDSAVGITILTTQVSIQTIDNDRSMPGAPPTVVITTTVPHDFFASSLYAFDTAQVKSTFKGIVTTYVDRPGITF